MNNKTKGVIAGIAGLALLGGGTTFALWSAEADVDGGIITSGNLDVAGVDDVLWFDVSDDRTDTVGVTPRTGNDAHAIDSLDTWRIVPGDTVEGHFPLAVALQGDNLVAELGVELPAGVVDSVEIYNASNVLVATGAGDSASVLLQAPGTGQSSGADDGPILVVNNTTLSGTPNVTLWAVVTISFDADDQDEVESTIADLSAVSVSLEQTRDSGVGNFG